MGTTRRKWLPTGTVSVFALACWFIFASAAQAGFTSPAPPVCDNSSVTVQAGTPTAIDFACSDSEGKELAIQFVSGLDHGSIQGHPNPLKYGLITPFGTLHAVYVADAGFTGGDYLTFRAVKLYTSPCPEPFWCPQVMSEIYSNSATVSIDVIPLGTPQVEESSTKNSCSDTKGLRSKLRKSRKKYRALKRRHKRYSRRAKVVRSGKLRRRYRSKAKRVRKSYRKTNKRSKRLRKRIVSCRAAGY